MQRPSGRSTPLREIRRPVLVVALVLVAAVPSLGVTSAAPSHLPVVITPSLAIGARLGNLSPGFWGADLRPYYTLGSTQMAQLNSTPVRFIRWPGGATADQYNNTANTIENNNGTTYSPPTNESEFVAWCRSVGCQAVFELPGEIDSPSTAAYYVAYTESTLKFIPRYWEIGNEPAQWTHFGIPWSQWTSSQNVNATPGSYAAVVQSYAAAIHRVDPNAHIVGLAGVGTGGYNEATWITATVRLNGPNLSAVAIHVYPAGGTSATNPTAASFAATLQGHGSLSYRVPIDRAAIHTACPKCAGIQLLVTELGSGTQGGPYSRFMSGFLDVPYLAAEVAQAMLLTVANVDIFAFQSTYNGSLLDPTGGTTSTFTLYSALLVHLQGVILNTTWSGAPGGVYAVAARNTGSTEYSLLVANVNASVAVSFSLLLSGFPLLGAGSAWTWGAPALTPASTSWALTMPSSWTVPPRSVLVIESS